MLRIEQVCFTSAIKSVLYSAKLLHYRNTGLEISYTLKDTPFSVELMNIKKFEKRSNISINLDSYEENKEKPELHILYDTTNKKG